MQLRRTRRKGPMGSLFVHACAEPGCILHNLLTVFTKEMTQFNVRHVSIHLLFVRKIQLRTSAFPNVVLCPALSTKQYSYIRVLNISCAGPVFSLI